MVLLRVSTSKISKFNPPTTFSPKFRGNDGWNKLKSSGRKYNALSFNFYNKPEVGLL